MKKYFTNKELNIIKRLGISIKKKIYTAYEFEVLSVKLLAYYKDKYMDEEELRETKSLENTGVNRKQYDKLMQKIEKVNEIYVYI